MPTKFEGATPALQRQWLRDTRNACLRNPGALDWIREAARDLAKAYGSTWNAADAINFAFEERKFEAALRIAPSTFDRFAKAENSKPKAPFFLALLVLFILCVRGSDVSHARTAVRKSIQGKAHLLKKFEDTLRWKENDASLKLEMDIVARLFDLSGRDPQQFTKSFRPKGYLPPGVMPEGESYYLVYRYSTSDGKVMRTFLVVNSPEKAGTRSWSFQHFNWGGKDMNERFFFAETEGEILALAKAYYFFGYTFKVDFNKRAAGNAVQQAKAARASARQNDIRGLELMACEHDTFDAGGADLIPAVALTFAAEYQPIIARLALLHLGTAGSLGRTLSDVVIQPDEFSIGNLAKDLDETIDRIRANQMQEMYFSGRLGQCYPQKDGVVSAELSSLAKDILSIIDNTAGFELRNSSKGDKPLENRGALEIHGKYRP